jgi:hypothetical protein
MRAMAFGSTRHRVRHCENLGIEQALICFYVMYPPETYPDNADFDSLHRCSSPKS